MALKPHFRCRLSLVASVKQKKTAGYTSNQIDRTMSNENLQLSPVEAVVPHTCVLAEGPVWDARQQSICWVDIQEGIIHEWNTRQQQHHKLVVGELIGAIALSEDGHFLAALQNGLAIVNRYTGEKKKLLHPEAGIPNNRYNDGKCDPAGRFWIGSMALDTKQGAGSLYRIGSDLHCTTMLENLTISNGLAWSLDSTTFYFIDTPTGEVAAFDYDKQTGNISGKRTVIGLEANEGMPDGMTIDTEGMLWIAHYGGWQVSRWNPATGKKLLSVPLPVEKVTSCTFGGPHLQDLFITTAKEGLTEKQGAEQPLAGSLFVWKDCGFTGIEPVRFCLSFL